MKATTIIEHPEVDDVSGEKGSGMAGDRGRFWLPIMALAAGFLLGSPAAGLADCTKCHNIEARAATWKSAHDPFTGKDCTSCHKEHGEKGELLFAETGNAMCVQCHEVSDESMQKAHRKMAVEKASCLGCHHPHASEKTKLLRPNIHRPLAYGECQDCHKEGGQLRSQKIALLCFRCHEPRSFQGASRHEPVAAGKCTSCHDPHGSVNPRLLTGTYSLERFVPYNEKTFGLCFSCHEAAAFAEAGTKADTGFKDQTDNLHYRHVVKKGTSTTGNAAREGGITCRNCHLPHAAMRPHLIRENLDCGQGVLCLKLAYTVRESIATCAAGCHKTASYISGRAADKSPAPTVLPADRNEEAGALPEVKDSPCLKCHAKADEGFRKAAFIHAPARKRRCTDCHLDHGNENKLTLIAYEGRLCARCHDEKSPAMKTAHGGMDPVGSHCLRCHDPHSGADKTLLLPNAHIPFKERSCDDCHDSSSGKWTVTKGVNSICKDCHDGPFQRAYLHSAFSKGTCTGCHSPHTTRLPKLLPAETPQLCWKCHDQSKFTLAARHAPVNDGDCGSCHEVHGSAYPNILIAAYPAERYLDYKAEQYNLCFTCHEEGPFARAESMETAFRNGPRNLHFLHVNKASIDKGQGNKTVAGTTCRNCHEPHSTEQPMLIRKSLDCGGVPCLNLDFKKIAITGRCAKGCHTPQTYSPGTE
jgi:predicted CXXCH cytochrome family protein